MRLTFFFYLLLLLPISVRADDSLESYQPPEMFEIEPEAGEKSPPLPPRRPEKFIASKAYLKELRKRTLPKRHKVIEMDARDVLEQIED